ncbi:MAG: hypothetical protein COA95_05010 [Methylophaga sp.]|nr:MAG: hypothetical protein COA95_05010 [Methylophaga sp.]
MTEIKENIFIAATRKQFVDELSKFSFLSNYKAWVDETYDEWDENEFQIYVGDVKSDEIIKFDALNLLVIGNIQSNWLSTVNNYEIGYDEGGSLFVAGDIDCNYFSNHYGKLIVIEGSLKASKILNNAFQDSTLIVKNNLVTEYFVGLDIWAEVGGVAEMTYGDGYCLPIGYTDAMDQSIKPKYSESDSHKFLKIEDKIQEYSDRASLVQEIIEQKNQ